LPDTRHSGGPSDSFRWNPCLSYPPSPRSIMNYTPRLLRQLCRTCAVLCAGLISALPVLAQTSVGNITGRVYNPVTKEYVRSAEVRLQGTNQVVTTADDGSYTLTNVPAGAATVVVTYTGSEASTAQVNVPAGGSVQADVSLGNPQEKAGADTVKMAAFTVSTEREGNAKAIQDQKESMNVSNIIAAETFGNVAEGNIGEFVKNLPGIQMDYVEADARSPRIRGLPAQFTTVTMDGMKMASADGFIQNNGTDNGGGAGAGDRSFGFEQVTMSSIDSIEVNFTTNASQDADSPAGNINLRSAHAYQLNRQQFGFTVSAFMNSEEMYLHRIVRPDTKSESLVLPNGSLNYANSFLDHRLG